MTTTLLIEKLIPLLAIMITFGMGLNLTTKQFSSLLKVPRSAIAGILAQIIVVPLLAFTLATIFKLPPALAIGLMIIGACPGGPVSNVFSQLAKGNMALSVSLTTLSTIICVVTTPLIIHDSILHFSAGQAEDFSILKTSMLIVVFTLVPLALGMILNAKKPQIAAWLEPIFKKTSVVFLVFVVASVIVQQQETLATHWRSVLTVTSSMNLIALMVGFAIAFAIKLNRQDSFTLAIETGIQNGSLALLIAFSILQKPEFAIVPVIYGLTMLTSAGLLVVVKYVMDREESYTTIGFAQEA